MKPIIPIPYCFFALPLTVLSLLALMTLSTFSYANDTVHTSPSSVSAITSVKITDNTYIIHGISGLPTKENQALIANLGFVVSQAGVIVIDSGGSHAHGILLLNEIARVTSAPVVAVFNTHIHGDHWLGNNAIAQRFPKAVFYAHEKMVEQANNGAGNDWITLFNTMTQGALKDTQPYAPSHPLSDRNRFDFGNISITTYAKESAHTTTDIIVAVEEPQQKRVVFLGDTSSHLRLGRMDDGDFKGNISALDDAIALKADIYVPGHGPSTHNSSAAVLYRDYLALLYQETARLYPQGLADFEIKEAIMPKFERWRTWEGFESAFGRHVNLLYLEIEEAEF